MPRSSEARVRQPAWRGSGARREGLRGVGAAERPHGLMVAGVSRPDGVLCWMDAGMRVFVEDGIQSRIVQVAW